LLWGLFIACLIVLVFIDLKIINREPHKVGIKEALLWTGGWVLLAALFGVGVYLFMGHKQGLDYFTGYVIEYSLSVDNIFVFLLVFKYFKVPKKLEYEILFWGVLGAFLFRLAFVLGGAALLQNFFWVIYLFGAFLLYTGVKMGLNKGKEVDPGQNPLIKWTDKFIPVSEDFHQDHFFIKQAGKRFATPMFVVLLVIETSDILFALDSIPAVLAITNDQFIVFSSNAMAILGLRTLYFALSATVEMFHYLHYGLAAILVFVGVKMIISEFYAIPTLYALGFIILILILTIGASILFPPKEPAQETTKT
jgi:tellurite resistance protein TerC